jgi:Nickel responsive protein SCO4226-like
MGRGRHSNRSVTSPDPGVACRGPHAADLNRIDLGEQPHGGWTVGAKGAPEMPLYLDVHTKIEGLTGDVAADAHRKDLEIQQKHGVKYLRYWFDEGTGKVFCLVEAPSREAAEAVHREAHGMMADEIIEVKEGT